MAKRSLELRSSRHELVARPEVPVKKTPLKKVEPEEAGERGDVGAQGEVSDAIALVAKLLKDVVPTAAIFVKPCDCSKAANNCPWIVLGPQNNDDTESLPYDIKIGSTSEGAEIKFGDGQAQPLAQGISGPFKGKLKPGQSIKVRYCSTGRYPGAIGHWPGSAAPPPPEPKD